jgi:hypothetical protein
MKNKLIAICSVAALAAVLAFAPGCTKSTLTTVTDGVTNTVTKTVISTNTLSDVRDVLEPVVAGGIRAALQNSPEHSEEIALYMRAVGTVFCDMSANHQFSPVYLVDALNQALVPNISNAVAVDIKNAAVAIYKIAFGNRFTAEIPADEWASQVCLLICDSVDTGLRDAGKSGIAK